MDAAYAVTEHTFISWAISAFVTLCKRRTREMEKRWLVMGFGLRMAGDWMRVVNPHTVVEVAADKAAPA